MAHNPITLDLLKALDAIDQRGSFAAAAQALHKVPSALSYTIQKVEQDLGLKLFDRSGHRAKLTAAGNVILVEGRLILRDIENLAFSAQQIAHGWEPVITLSIDTLFSSSGLFPLIQRFNQAHPFIKVNLLTGSLSGTWEPLLNRTADLVIASAQTDPKQEGFDNRTLGSVTMMFAVNRSHPLADHACVVTEAMIDAYPVIVVRDSSLLLTPMTLGWTRQTKVITVASMDEKIAAQKAGLGVGYLPQHRIEAELERGELIALKIDSNTFEAQVAWRKGATGPALQWLLNELTGADLGLDAAAC
ncbi:LysR substrate-binding domain-containing protein [Reinekea sp.]|jgi:DNA-binding transcriptional LysR family regulator|uniref:LysR substrate-binding domain-containing protein n=1 Tax=Reinekea sp. TaxID=1970455 RepID=UPI002A801E7F|nr:LysR substrate-binding domain-containing protein [Reinekea sp.]